eukprot:265328_1
MPAIPPDRIVLYDLGITRSVFFCCCRVTIFCWVIILSECCCTRCFFQLKLQLYLSVMIGPQLPTKLKRNRDDEKQEPPLKRKKLTETKENESESKENKLMHPRNIYRYNKPNYYKLSLKYKFFAQVLKQNNKTGDYYINYNDPKSNVMLTKVLLKNDFNLEFEHPINHLCPPITQRLNYILWIQDLLQCINKNNNKYHGFDIGVGASCIFPLLGIKIGEEQNQLWSFIASDIDEESIQFANKNIEINNLNTKIKVIHQTNSEQIFKGIISKPKQTENTKNDILFDFTVCNPPFFEHLEQTGLNNARNNNATYSELVYEDGGEVGFIKLMIDEIIELKLYNKIRWFTTMLGKKSSIKLIENMINKTDMNVFIVTNEFFQGKQMRWGLAWTYVNEIKNKYNVLYNKKEIQTKLLEKNEFLFDLMVGNDVDYNKCVRDKIEILFQKYGIKYDEKLCENDNGWIEVDNIKHNGFGFSMKWIIRPDNNQMVSNKNKVKLVIVMSLRYHKGDKQLFDGFVKWFEQQCST